MIRSFLKLVGYEILYRIVLHCYMLPALWYLGKFILLRGTYQYLDLVCVTFMGVTIHFYLVRNGILAHIQTMDAKAAGNHELPDFPDSPVIIHEVLAVFLAWVASTGTYVLRHGFVNAFWTIVLMWVLYKRVTTYLKEQGANGN